MSHLETLHRTYTAITGIPLTYQLHKRTWFDFAQAGFTEENLKQVLAWIKKHNAKADYKYSLKLSTLIGDLSHFDELLGLARLRHPQVRSQGQKTLDAFRGYQKPMPTNKVINIKDALKKAVNGL